MTTIVVLPCACHVTKHCDTTSSSQTLDFVHLHMYSRSQLCDINAVKSDREVDTIVNVLHLLHDGTFSTFASTCKKAQN